MATASTSGDRVSLGDLLVTKAQEGVDIDILLYREKEAVLNLGSAHAQELLTERSGGKIQVMGPCCCNLSAAPWEKRRAAAVAAAAAVPA